MFNVMKIDSNMSDKNQMQIQLLIHNYEWYIIVINIEANMIITLLQEKLIYREKLISSETENVWYVIMISAEANMMLMIKVFRREILIKK